jgi:hypothetical protein
MARYGLMRLVHPSDRELARLRMLASAAVYGPQVDLMPAPACVCVFSDANAAAGEFASTFRSGDADGMEASGRCCELAPTACCNTMWNTPSSDGRIA